MTLPDEKTHPADVGARPILADRPTHGLGDSASFPLDAEPGTYQLRLHLRDGAPGTLLRLRLAGPTETPRPVGEIEIDGAAATRRKWVLPDIRVTEAGRNLLSVEVLGPACEIERAELLPTSAAAPKPQPPTPVPPTPVPSTPIPPTPVPVADPTSCPFDPGDADTTYASAGALDVPAEADTLDDSDTVGWCVGGEWAQVPMTLEPGVYDLGLHLRRAAVPGRTAIAMSVGDRHLATFELGPGDDNGIYVLRGVPFRNGFDGLLCLETVGQPCDIGNVEATPVATAETQPPPQPPPPPPAAQLPREPADTTEDFSEALLQATEDLLGGGRGGLWDEPEPEPEAEPEAEAEAEAPPICVESLLAGDADEAADESADDESADDESADDADAVEGLELAPVSAEPERLDEMPTGLSAMVDRPAVPRGTTTRRAPGGVGAWSALYLQNGEVAERRPMTRRGAAWSATSATVEEGGLTCRAWPTVGATPAVQWTFDGANPATVDVSGTLTVGWHKLHNSRLAHPLLKATVTLRHVRPDGTADVLWQQAAVEKPTKGWQAEAVELNVTNVERELRPGDGLLLTLTVAGVDAPDFAVTLADDLTLEVTPTAAV